MDIQGERRLIAGRDEVWSALNDFDLRRTLRELARRRGEPTRAMRTP